MADSPRRAALAAAALALAVGLYGAHLRRAQPEPIGPHPWFDSAPRLPAEAAEAEAEAAEPAEMPPPGMRMRRSSFAVMDTLAVGRIAKFESVRKQRWGRAEALDAARRYNALAR